MCALRGMSTGGFLSARDRAKLPSTGSVPSERERCLAVKVAYARVLLTLAHRFD